MNSRSTVNEDAPLSLVERKQRAARARIVEVADALFDERGFDSVSVTDIAERAEVGRTTFFRHFGDKIEVVFAKEQALFDAIAEATLDARPAANAIDSLADALRALEPLVVRLCQQATADLGAYERHVLLVDAHEELRAREALKHQETATKLSQVLLEHDTPHEVAVVAAQLAVACYSSGRILSVEPCDLVARTREAFRLTIAMDSGRELGQPDA